MVGDKHASRDERLCVDEEWYLREYPDVAAAGFTAISHYIAHGRAEGRLPKPLLSRSLETKLWSGFSCYAFIELNDLFYDELSDYDERMYAALALARWHSSRNEWTVATPYAEHITVEKSIPSYLKCEGAEIIVANIYINNKKFTDADNAIARMDLSIVSEMDQLLLKANLLTASSSDSAGPLALEPINTIFQKASLTQFDPEQIKFKIGFHNLGFMTSCPEVVAPQKISVIMPAYNAKDSIELALRGILNQSWTNIEVIVVDDASTDNTAEIVSKIAKIDSRVRLLKHHFNQGAYAARNTAWRVASGEFITNHDSDDWSHPQKLEMLANPLLNDASIQLSMCSWARVNSDFLFIRSRPDLKIIHPSVSTSLIRLDVLRELDGWDEVKVAADSELLERIHAIYGQSAIAVVLPQIPLVFSRVLENSLTTSPATHWSSEHFGLRDIYKQSYEYWHKLIAQKKVRPIIKKSGSSERAFYVPAMNLVANCERHHFNLVVYADLNDHSPQSAITFDFITKASKTAIRFAIFHWPHYESQTSNLINPNYIRMASEGCYELLTPGQTVKTENLVLFSNGNFTYHPDRLPLVNFDKLISVSDCCHGDKLIAEIDISLLNNFKYQLDSSGLFDSDWYQALYPDIRNSGICPFDHFINHGFKEGRSPSPAVNSEYYEEQYLATQKIKTRGLLHYLNKGRHLGYMINNPILQGLLETDLSKQTILACAHASDPNVFGAERNFLDFVKAMSLLGYNIIVTLPRYANHSYIDSIRKYSSSIYIVPYPLWSQCSSPSQWSIKKLEDIILNESIDAVYSNTLILREPLIAAKNLNIPSACHAHEIFEIDDTICIDHKLTPKEIYAEIFKLSTLLIANSQFTASCLGAQPDRCLVIPNSISMQKFNINPGIDSETIKIGLISSNIEKKGLLDFIMLADIVEQSTTNARFLIIGPRTPYLEEILKQAPSNVCYMGYIDSSMNAVSELDIVLNLSTCRETFGRTVLEGMAAGRVVISYDRGALPELIDNCVTGFTVPFKNLSKIAEIIATLCENTALIENIGRKAKNRVQRLFSEPVIQKKIKIMLETLLNT